MVWVKRHDIYAGGAVHREVQVVRHDELIILGEPSLQRNALCVAVEALVRLVWPREEKAAARPILQAIQAAAKV